MNKMAVFVEGYTELLFVEHLINAVSAENAVVIETRQLVSNRARLLTAAKRLTGATHFFLILDCRNDAMVKTRMRKEYPTLAKAGYQRIVCLRDVYPDFTYEEIPRLEVESRRYVPTVPIPVTFILAVMETEAWMLAEHSHFARVHPSLSPAGIAASLGFDPCRDDMMLRPHPADDLTSCYRLAGLKYSKGNAEQIGTLDFTNIYLTVARRFPHLQNLCDAIDDFLA